MTRETLSVSLQSTALPTELSRVKKLSEEPNNVPSVGIEPTTLGLLDPRSNQLSYEGESDWKLCWKSSDSAITTSSI